MKRPTGKLITALLCITMLIGMLPMTALAAEGGKLNDAYDIVIPGIGNITDIPGFEDLITLPSVGATPSPDDPYGVIDDGIYWYLQLSSGTLIITGEGEMKNFSSNGAPWYKNRASIKSVVIEGDITSIGNNAFRGCHAMSSISLPETITSIGSYAFYECKALKELALPVAVSSIGDRAFGYCEALTEMTIPEGITASSIYMMEGCKALEVVNLPASLTVLEAYSFSGCAALHKISFGELTTIGASAFSGCKALEVFNVPASVKSIGANAFNGSGITMLKLPAGIVTINCLGNMEALNTVYLPASVQEIEANQFAASKDLAHVDYGSDKLDWKKIEIDSGNDPLTAAEFAYNVASDISYSGGIEEPEVTPEVTPTPEATPEVTPDVAPTPEVTPAPETTPTTKPEVTPAPETTPTVKPEVTPAPETTPTVKPEVTPAPEATPTVKPEVTPTVKPEVTPEPTPFVPATPVPNPDLDPETCKHTLHFLPPVDATCTESGMTGKIICGKGCGAVLLEPTVKEALGHYYKKGVCSRCGHVAGQPEVPPAADGTPFVDIKTTDWFYLPVLWAVENNITGGTSANTFSPDDTCTRAQIVTFLWAAAGKPEPTASKSPFADVKAGDWYYKPVLWAVENDITSGTTATSFSPNIPCSRAQVVALLYKAMGSPAVMSGENPFTDVSDANYYCNAVLWAVENGVASGMSETSFGSNQPCTRAQIATFLYKAYNK